jgi:hypothetical protein
MFVPYRAINRSYEYYNNRFNHFQYILGSHIVYIDSIVVTTLYAIVYIKVKTIIKILVCFRYYRKQTNFYFNNNFNFNVNNRVQHYYNYTIYVNNVGSQNVLEVTEPVLIIRPDDGLIGPKHVA